MSIVLSYLNQQKQWNDESDIQHVVDDLNNNEHSVTTLHLTGNTMGIKAAEMLTEPLSKQSNIARLLWSDLFTGRGKDQIGFALKALSLGLMNANVHLVELDLSDNAFGPNGVVGVTDLIASSCCYTLKVLNMNNQGLGHQGCRALVKAMKAARVNSNKLGLNLEVFIAGRNRLENEGMEMLSEVFGDGMSSLKKLVLLQNGIGIHGIRGVESLIVAIRNHKNLRILNISDNNIKPNGMNILSNVLPEFEHLEELYMDDCLLGRKGADMFSLIAEDRSICSDLKIISLSGNEMKGTAAMTLINSIIEGKPSIEKIDLRENEVKKATVVEMLHVLSKFDKEEILVKDDVTSDDEEEVCDDESSEDESQNSDEESQNSDEDSNNSEEENSDEVNVEDDGDDKSEDSVEQFAKSTNNNGTETKEKSTIFTFPTSSASNSLFGNSSKSNGLFSTPKQTSNIFGTSNEVNNPFGNSINARTNIFGGFPSPAKTQSSIFTADEVSSINLNTTGAKLFSFSEAAKPNTVTNVAKPTGLFGNAFSNASFGSKLFSFTEAARPDTIEKQLKSGIESCLRSDSLMSLDQAALKVAVGTPVSALVDPTLKTLLHSNPEKGVRVGLILCKESNTFELGVAIIGQLLASPERWSQSTNAVLVEMDCIKSEEKRFVPFCRNSPGVPAKVLKELLAMDRLSDDVKSNLSVILKNFNKIATTETDDLLKELDSVMNKLSI